MINTMSERRELERRQAVRTAGDRLRSIERWTRMTFLAAAIQAALVCACIAFVTWKYWQVTSAFAAMSDSMGGHGSAPPPFLAGPR